MIRVPGDDKPKPNRVPGDDVRSLLMIPGEDKPKPNRLLGEDVRPLPDLDISLSLIGSLAKMSPTKNVCSGWLPLATCTDLEVRVCVRVGLGLG